MASSREIEFRKLRFRMVDRQIIRRGITDPRLIQAMETVPRHLFVPENYRDQSYDDTPLPIGENQTISQPYIVAFMTEKLEVLEHHRVLEIGTGSGYHTAILAQLAGEVITVELVPGLYKTAQARLEKLGYTNVRAIFGDGSLGWQEGSPYDRIIVTASTMSVPEALLEQLAPMGKMVLPVGAARQFLMFYEKDETGKVSSRPGPRVRFVPMTGLAEKLN